MVRKVRLETLTITHRAGSVSRRRQEKCQSCVQCCLVGLFVYICTRESQSLSCEVRPPFARHCMIEIHRRTSWSLLQRAHKYRRAKRAMSLGNDQLLESRVLQVLPRVLCNSVCLGGIGNGLPLHNTTLRC